MGSNPIPRIFQSGHEHRELRQRPRRAQTPIGSRLLGFGTTPTGPESLSFGMSVVVEFGLDSGEFELGRILELTAGEELQLEAVVPTGERAVPSFWTDGVDVEAFEGRVRDHEAVESLTAVQTAGERCLYALEWNRRSDPVIAGIRAEGGQLLQASAEADGWEFQIRFPTRGPLSAYQSRLRDAGIVPSIRRVYTPSDLDSRAGYGLTDSQREA